MLSRRVLRIRVFQFLFSLLKQQDVTRLDSIKKNLFQSLEKTYRFYFILLSLLSEFKRLEQEDIDNKKRKKTASTSDLNPSTKLIQNQFINAIGHSKEFKHHLEKHKINFGYDEDWVKIIFKDLKQSELYQSYISSDSITDFNFIDTLLKDFIYHHDLTEHFFEENSAFAADDLYISTQACIRTLEKFEETKVFTLITAYKNEAIDKLFAEELLEKTFKQFDSLNTIIEKYSKNWEIDRINYTDLLLIKMATTELMFMPDVPIKVTVDEYLEISKEYSSPNSYIFINGMLDNIIKELSNNKLIKKN